MTVERIVNDPAAAAASIASGGHLQRHSVVMVLDLARTAPREVDGYSFAPMSPELVIQYAEVIGRAYPPEHLDHDAADADPDLAAQVLLDAIRGKSMGPWIADASLHAADLDDRVVGLVLINETIATGASSAGPFVTDICIDPAAAGRGLGAALLANSAHLLAGLGWSTLTLVVTVGNPAQRLYERMGFAVTAESWRIETGTSNPPRVTADE